MRGLRASSDLSGWRGQSKRRLAVDPSKQFQLVRLREQGVSGAPASVALLHQLVEQALSIRLRHREQLRVASAGVALDGVQLSLRHDFVAQQALHLKRRCREAS